LEEIRRQEARTEEDQLEDVSDQQASEAEASSEAPPPAQENEQPKSSGQQTLMGYGSDA